MTRENKSRTNESSNRENSERLEFKEYSPLDIPEGVIRRFASQGMKLRWIRVLLKNDDDYNNVGKRTSEGWEIVQADEVPEIVQNSFVREAGNRYEGAVCRGDLALAKMPIELAQSRQEFYQNKSRQAVQAVNDQLMNASDSRMPISNNSKTKVSRGRQASFQD